MAKRKCPQCGRINDTTRPYNKDLHCGCKRSNKTYFRICKKCGNFKFGCPKGGERCTCSDAIWQERMEEGREMFKDLDIGANISLHLWQLAHPKYRKASGQMKPVREAVREGKIELILISRKTYKRIKKDHPVFIKHIKKEIKIKTFK